MVEWNDEISAMQLLIATEKEELRLRAQQEARRRVSPGGAAKNWELGESGAGFPVDDVIPPSMFWRDWPPEQGRDQVPRGFGYPGGVHVVYGPAKVGKTYLAGYWAAQEIRQRHHVAWYSFEPQQGLTERLRASGALDEHAVFFHHRPASGVPSARDIEQICEDIRSGPFSLVVLDAFRGLQSLIAPGTSANDGDAVEAVNQRLLVPLARAGAAVLVIDHQSKDTAITGPTGSERKGTMGDVVMKLTRGAAFSRGTDGWARLTVEYDRYGYNGPDTDAFFSVTGSVPDFTETCSAPGSPGAAARFMADAEPAVAKRGVVLGRVRAFPGYYESARMLAKDLSESSGGVPRTWERVIRELVKDGVLMSIDGKFVAKNYPEPKFSGPVE